MATRARRAGVESLARRIHEGGGRQAERDRRRDRGGWLGKGGGAVACLAGRLRTDGRGRLQTPKGTLRTMWTWVRRERAVSLCGGGYDRPHALALFRREKERARRERASGVYAGCATTAARSVRARRGMCDAPRSARRSIAVSGIMYSCLVGAACCARFCRTCRPAGRPPGRCAGCESVASRQAEEERKTTSP